MKTCQKCKCVCSETAAFCPSCGAPLEAGQPAPAPLSAPAGNAPQPQAQPRAQQDGITAAFGTPAPTKSNDKGLRLAAFIVDICVLAYLGIVAVSTFSLFSKAMAETIIALVPLAWTIPMTVLVWGTYKGKYRNTIALGVCHILFFNIISGILLLCSKKDEKN